MTINFLLNKIDEFIEKSGEITNINEVRIIGKLKTWLKKEHEHEKLAKKRKKVSRKI
jgi:hypothetical protein